MRVIEQRDNRVHISIRVVGKDSNNEEIDIERMDFRIDGPTISDVNVFVPKTV